MKTKKAFVEFPSTCGFVVKRLLDLKKIPQETARCVSKNQNCFDKCTFGDRTLAYSAAKVQGRFYPEDLITCTGDQEIHSGRLLDLSLIHI